jgi:hypothetical protein
MTNARLLSRFGRYEPHRWPVAVRARDRDVGADDPAPRSYFE